MSPFVVNWYLYSILCHVMHKTYYAKLRQLPLSTNKGPSWSWSYGSWIYNYLCNYCLSSLTFRRGLLDTTLCDNVYQWRVAGWWFSPGNSFLSTNKTDLHDITEILLKVTLNTITLTLNKAHTIIVRLSCSSKYHHQC